MPRKPSSAGRAQLGVHPYLTSAGICTFLVLIVWIVFGPTLGHQFVNYDDDNYVYANPHITSGLTQANIGRAFTHVHAANWHPLTTISHMLDCQLYGIQPWGHHLTNVLLHTVATILLFLTLRALTRSVWPSAFVAALFAIHPLRVESVAWISERKDVLSGVFFMFTLLAYARYVRSKHFSLTRYLTVLILFALGLMCKPTLVTVPFVLFLLDYWPFSRVQKSDLKTSPWWPLIWEKIPFFGLSAASCLITLRAQTEAFVAIGALPLHERVANAAVSYVDYFRQMFYPSHLAVLYSYPQGRLKNIEIVLALLLLWVVPAGSFFLRKCYPFLLVGWFWFVGMLVPMIGLVQVGSQARADRYTYLPQIGLYILITWSAIELVGRTGRILVSAAAVLIITVMSVVARNQTSVWANSVSLWHQAVEVSPTSHIAHKNLGNAFLEQNRIDDAIAQFHEALAIRPDAAPAENNLGNALLRQGHMDEAVTHFQRALRIDPTYVEAYNNMGSALIQQGRIEEAFPFYERALQLNPDYADAHNNLATALLKTGRLNEVIEHYKKAVELKPLSAEIQCNLGNAFAKTANWMEAIASYQRALAARPNYAQAWNNLGVALEEVGRNDEAFASFDRALQISPDYPEAHCNLGRLLAQRGRRDEAIAHLSEALGRKPDYEDAKKELRQLGIER